MEPLATIAELAERLGFVMDEDETREALGALQDLSDDARHYGSDAWQTPAEAPRPVVNLVLRAARRHMKNPDGFTSSRAGDESVAFNEKGEDAGSAVFTRAEQDRLAEWGGSKKVGFWSVGAYAYGRKFRKRVEGLVPDEASNEPIQMFSCDEEPW